MSSFEVAVADELGFLRRGMKCFGYANSIALPDVLIFEATNWSGTLFKWDCDPEFSVGGRLRITMRLNEIPMACTRTSIAA